MKRGYILILVALLLVQAAYAKSGHMKLVAVSNVEDNPQGSIANLDLEIEDGTGRVFIDSFPLSKVDTQISTRFAKEMACNFLERDCSNYDFYYTIRANSPIIGGPSASAAITLLTISVLDDLPLDDKMTITGTINAGGIIGPVGGIPEKIQAASQNGLTTVLIPKYSNLNESNITEISQKNRINVVEVSQLTDALKLMTGKDFSSDENFTVSGMYTETMQSISADLCRRASKLSNESYPEGGENISALDLLSKGEDALNHSEYYSAASFCFGSGLGSRNKQLQDLKLSDGQLLLKINNTKGDIADFKDYIERQDLKTITDLEAYMAVVDRLFEADRYLDSAVESLQNNDTNLSISQTAYGIERFNSAKSWSDFLGQPGRDFVINRAALEESCLKKVSEVEERLQYIEYYLPTETEDIRTSIRQSYENYNKGEPELCLYESSIAKARVDLILSGISLQNSQADELIDDRNKVVRSILAKQDKRGIFPILAYSYYEYGNSLRNSDKYSSLLYLGYALELGNLDIYFERQKLPLQNVLDNQMVHMFLLGMFVGGSLVILGRYFFKRK